MPGTRPVAGKAVAARAAETCSRNASWPRTPSKTVYHQEYRRLYQKLFADGTALASLDQLTGALQKNGVAQAQIDSDAEKLRTTVQARTTALAKDDVVTGITP